VCCGAVGPTPTAVGPPTVHAKEAMDNKLASFSKLLRFFPFFSFFPCAPFVTDGLQHSKSDIAIRRAHSWRTWGASALTCILLCAMLMQASYQIPQRGHVM
jgi:hypothetical protein